MGMFDMGGTSLQSNNKVEVARLDATAAAATQSATAKDISTDNGQVRGDGEGLYVPPAERGEEVDPLAALDVEGVAINENLRGDVGTLEELEASNTEDIINEEAIEEGEAEQLDDTSGYAGVMSTMVDSGFLVANEDKEYTPDDLGFQDLVRENIEAGRQGYVKIDDQPEEFQDFLKAKAVNESLDYKDFIDNAVFEEDYSKVDVSLEAHQEALLMELGDHRGEDRNDILDDIESWRLNGTMSRRASAAKKQLVKAQDGRLLAKEQAIDAANNAKSNAKKAEVAKFTADVMAMDKVNGIKLSQAEKIAIVAYDTVRVGPKGETQAQLDSTFENKVFSIYAQKNKLDMNKLERKTETKSNLKLKNTLRLKTDKIARPKNSSKPAPKTSNQDINQINWALGSK